MYGDPNEDKKFKVWNAMHGIIQAIENRIDSETVYCLVCACNLVTYTSELGWGIQPITPYTWKRLVKINEEEDIGIDEMVEVGVDLYFSGRRSKRA